MSVGDGENINRTRNAAAGDNKKKRVLNLVKRFYKLDAPSFKKEGYDSPCKCLILEANPSEDAHFRRELASTRENLTCTYRNNVFQVST